MRTQGIDEVVVINCWLALKKVAVIQKEKEGVLLHSVFFHISIYVCERVGGLTPGDKIVGEDHAMNICGNRKSDNRFMITTGSCAQKNDSKKYCVSHCYVLM